MTHDAPVLISDTNTLIEFCNRQATADFVTVDTEFMRETTFWAKLCLIQVAGPDEAVCIDPLAPGINLKPLYALFANEKVLKVFHAARQDLEIFLHEGGGPSSPRVRHAGCGHGVWVRRPGGL